MDTLDNIIDHLSDEAALATLAVVLWRAAWTTHADAGLFTLGALVLLAMYADVEVRKAPAKGWYFHFRIKPLSATLLGKVLHLLYSKFLG
jgi:hypothetical protein